MTREVEIHVEQTAEAMAARFVDAWRRAERGEVVDERHLSFESWKGLSRVLTAKRLELRRHPAASVAALARAIGRDYKRVHEDVEALAESGLLTRDEAGLRTGYDEIRATIAV
jgi:predicted transcriptional regulator